MPRASFRVDVQSNFDQITKLVPKAFKHLVPVAASRALNKTMGPIKTATVKKTAKRLGVKLSRVRDSFTVKKAFRERLFTRMRIGRRSRKPFNVIRFTADETATQTAGGVKHGAWAPGKKSFAKGAFLMPKSGRGRKAAGRTMAKRPGARRGKAPRRKNFTANVGTHFVAKRKGGKISGVFGGWPAREFEGRRGGTNTPGLNVNATKAAVQQFPPRYYAEMQKAIDVSLGKLKFRGRQPKSVVRRIKGVPRIVRRRPIGPVGVLPG